MLAAPLELQSALNEGKANLPLPSQWHLDMLPRKLGPFRTLDSLSLQLPSPPPAGQSGLQQTWVGGPSDSELESRTKILITELRSQWGQVCHHCQTTATPEGRRAVWAQSPRAEGSEDKLPGPGSIAQHQCSCSSLSLWVSYPAWAPWSTTRQVVPAGTNPEATGLFRPSLYQLPLTTQLFSFLSLFPRQTPLGYVFCTVCPGELGRVRNSLRAHHIFYDCFCQTMHCQQRSDLCHLVFGTEGRGLIRQVIHCIWQALFQ